MNEQWLTIVEYARACNVSDMTVRRRIRNGKLNAILREGKYLIPLTGRPIPNTPAFPVTEGATNTKNSPGDYRGTQVREQGVVKNHPAAHATVNVEEFMASASTDLYADAQLSRSQHQAPAAVWTAPTNQLVQKKHLEHGAANFIPKALSNPVAKHETVSFEAAALIEFCESMARRLDKTEESVRRECQAKQAELETKLQVKDLEILQLKQQVEDLQLLISIIDRSK
jgi:hypothetical protein